MKTSQSQPIAKLALAPASLQERTTLVKVLVLACAIPIVGELLTHLLGYDVRWVNIPVHAVVEALGLFAGVILAALLILLRRYNSAYAYHLWTASGLVVMGILDGFHAASMPSQTFVWFHSVATLGGGIFFCMVWLPTPVTNWIRDRWIVGVTFAGAVFLGVACMAWPSMVPTMLEKERFTTIAIAVNFVGGLGFLTAAAWFLSRLRQAISIDDSFFAALSLLFGMAGVFFFMSRLWDFEWWFWHMLRLLAYLVVMGQTFRFYKRNLDEIQANALHQERQQRLEELVAARTVELKASETELRDSRDKLEERVRERTADLQSANAALLAEKGSQEALIEKLHNAQNQLLQSDKMASIGQLAAGVAHEINNPIGYVNSNLGTLEKYLQDIFAMLEAYEQAEPLLAADPTTAARVKVLRDKLDIEFLKNDVGALMKESEEGISRVTKIVHDLKDFSHVDESEWQMVDLHKGLESTLNLVRNEIKYKAEVVKEYGNLQEIECLPSQINQVFMNMLVNAAHAIESLGTITIRTGMQGDEAWVEFADSGKGIPPENLKRIFEPFFTTKPVGKGTGLGLSLSYSIVQKHHGRIEVASEMGKGTTFRITLPVKQPGKDK